MWESATDETAAWIAFQIRFCKAPVKDPSEEERLAIRYAIAARILQISVDQNAVHLDRASQSGKGAAKQQRQDDVAPDLNAGISGGGGALAYGAYPESNSCFPQKDIYDEGQHHGQASTQVKASWH